MNLVSGIHHVTSICSDAQTNINFITGVLGLRLVKLTVNFDDPGAYHLYYGDEIGRPGTILTTFAWPGATRAQSGKRSIYATALAVPVGSLPFWRDYLRSKNVGFTEPPVRFGESVLQLRDPDGLIYELIESAQAERGHAWQGGPIPVEYAVRGIHSVTLAVEATELTAQVLTEELGFVLADQSAPGEAHRLRFRAQDGAAQGIGGVVDLACMPDAPRAGTGAGGVHHVAFRTPDAASQLEFRRGLVEARLNVSPVMDRTYFESIYFREPGGILFEIATDAPGFTWDETRENLGTSLKLPPQYESYRVQIEAQLAPLSL